MARTLLYEAANAMLSRTTPFGAEALGDRDRQAAQLKRAKVALAGELTTVMHRMWVDGTRFRWSKEAGPAAGMSRGE